MPRAYVDIASEFNGGRARSYAERGDYERAARTVLADDPSQAQSYAAMGDRLRTRQREDEAEGARRTYADAVARNDYGAAESVAAKTGNIEGVTGARGLRDANTREQRLAVYRGAMQGLSQWDAIGEAQGQGYEDFLARGRAAAQQNPEAAALVEGLPDRWSPGLQEAYRQRIIDFRNSLLSPEEAIEMEQTNRQRDIQERTATAAERRADAAETTAQAALQRAENGGGVSGSQEFSRANSLRDEYNQQTASYRTIADIAARSEAYVGRIPQSGASGQGDVGLVYALAKIYDPTSVVREGEFATMARQGGYGEQMRSWVLQAQGQGFSPQIRNQILTEIRNGVQSAQQQRDQTRTRYTGLAQRAGLDPALVIDDYQASGSPSAGGGGAPRQRPANIPADYVWNQADQTWDPPN